MTDLTMHRAALVVTALGAALLVRCSGSVHAGKRVKLGWGITWLGTCDGPLVTAADARPILGAPRRGQSEGEGRLARLRQAHCGLAQRLLDDVRAERRILDEGNSNQTFQFPGLDEVRRRLRAPSPALNNCMRTADATLLSVDMGEWGGGIAVVDRAGAHHIVEGNVMTIARTSAGLIAIGGLDFGFLGEIRLDGPGPHVASVACLLGEPKALAVAGDGTLLVVSGRPWRLIKGSPPRFEKGSRDFISFALDDDGSLYDLGCDPGIPGARVVESWSSSVTPFGCQSAPASSDGADAGLLGR